MNHEQFIELVRIRADVEAQLRFIEEQRRIIAEQTRRILELLGRRLHPVLLWRQAYLQLRLLHKKNRR